ncbi:SOS response-associated peptidase [Pseudonocardia sp. C8]|uniref:SOS response-associated peptidase n=1 Tax=Pseudonocardia sp. C8 TaxID=2762759 RepID=UPI001642E809|nr:SOS response-associated peptidase [Pseudonocardia sp. C8]MBC3193722.1 SOS response-associated peptidase [Pseudonocardia sp. C8]
MCGRYASTKAPADLADEFHAVDATAETAQRPDYNVAPTKDVTVVVERHPRDEEGNADPATTERSLRTVRWGLVPFWAKDPSAGARMVNARSETITEKPAFRRAAASRRCLFPMDGWYEWQRSKSAKQPYFTHYADGATMAVAGLWEFWRPKDGELAEKYPDGLVTGCVLTTEAVGPLAQVHDRMPLVLPPDAWGDWLDPDAGPTEGPMSRLLVPPPPELVSTLEIRPVSTRVNSVRNNGPELLDRLPDDQVAEPIQLDLLS